MKISKYIIHNFLQEEYSQRRRLSTPSDSPSPPRTTRLSRSTGTLTREEESFCESNNTLTKKNQGQEAERKGWFKSLSRKNKSNIKVSFNSYDICYFSAYDIFIYSIVQILYNFISE